MEPAGPTVFRQPRPSTVTLARKLLYLLMPISIILSAGTAVADKTMSPIFSGLWRCALPMAVGFDLARGRKSARIVVWVWTAAVVLNSVVVVRAVVRNSSAGVHPTKPGWYEALDVSAATIGAVVISIAAVLLVLPDSRPFFRTPPAPQPPAPEPPATAEPSSDVDM